MAASLAAVHADHPVGDRSSERVGHRGAEDRQRSAIRVDDREVGRIEDHDRLVDRVDDASGAIDPPGVPGQDGADRRGSRIGCRLSFQRILRTEIEASGVAPSDRRRPARSHSPTCIVARAPGGPHGTLQTSRTRRGRASRTSSVYWPSQTELAAPDAGGPKGDRVPMHLAPADLRSVRQDGLAIRFGILGPIAYALAEVLRTGSAGTALERPCVRPHWGFVLAGDVTLHQGGQAIALPVGNAFHVRAGGPEHHFEASPGAVVSGFEAVRADVDTSARPRSSPRGSRSWGPLTPGRGSCRPPRRRRSNTEASMPTSTGCRTWC